MRTLGLELRYAARSIRKRPAMSAVIIITLALGLGANAAIFSIVDALVLRPFTLPDVDRIALIGYTRAAHRQGPGPRRLLAEQRGQHRQPGR